MKSPKISSFSWGNVQVDGKSYKDVKLYPGGCNEWDWNETGTHHSPGIQPADVKALLNHNAEIIIFSKGINQRLKTSKQTKRYLDERGIKYYILQSEEAVEKYNELRKDKAVGALIHSTC